ncbi:hydroxyproline dehydrogenase-like isoform X2 [Tachypleus tridentatus]|uniref:hydroxyproline dehydrogenase-like isoform X2 n=1 Tax=Tachypleus tridentatus TaxID=6853 RepID=UPI003FD0A946
MKSSMSCEPLAAEKCIMTFIERTFGHWFLKTLVKPTFYKQFVGGENKEELADCIQQLERVNIRPMLACTMETDVGEGMDQEDLFDKNAQKILDCLEFSSSLTTKAPLMQLKVTGLLSADILTHMANIYATSTKALSMVENIANGMINGQLKTSEIFCGLTRKEGQCLEHAVRRFHKIGMMAQIKAVKVLVDAEYTYLNPAINLLTMALMATFNKDSPVIWNTYQCYLKKALQAITTEVEMSQKLGVCFGAKIVRGAYMVQEQQRADRLGYPRPTCENYEATNNNYNMVVKYMLNHVKTAQSRCNIIIATHNEESVKQAIRRIKKLGIQHHLGTVNFGQLLGMSDQITFPLASAGFTVYKSIPYGPLGEVLPYLARRAMENQTVLAGARKEQQLLWQEIKSRAKDYLTPSLRGIPARTS